MTQCAAVPLGTVCYTIAFTIRSGSNLLGDLLARNGYGVPTEYFQCPFGSANKVWYDQLHVPFDDFPRFIERLLAVQSANGIFGSKVAWDHKNALIAGLRKAFDPGIRALEDFFPTHVWLYIRRRDRVAQAVSAWVAHRTGAWTSSQARGMALVDLDYDYYGILSSFMPLLVEEFLWERFFQQTRRQPIRTWYEDLVASPATELFRILAELSTVHGRPAPDPSALVVDSQYDKQADCRSAVFIERFWDDLYHVGVADHWRTRERDVQTWARFFHDRSWRAEAYSKPD